METLGGLSKEITKARTRVTVEDMERKGVIWR